jgi:hypothetical protein
LAWLGLALKLLSSLIKKTEVVLEKLVSPPFNQLRGLLSRQESSLTEISRHENFRLHVFPPLLSRKLCALFTIHFFTTFISFKTTDDGPSPRSVYKINLLHKPAGFAFCKYHILSAQRIYEFALISEKKRLRFYTATTDWFL